MDKNYRNVPLLLSITLLALGSNLAQAGQKSCDSRVNNTQKKLLQCVTTDGVRIHQAQFQTFATAMDGSRSVNAGSGYELSADYVASLMQAAGYDVSIEEVDYPFFQVVTPATLDQVLPIPTSYPFSDPNGFATMTYSGSGNVVAIAEGVELHLADPGLSTSGCNASDFAGFTPGNIAIVQRGACTFGLKAQNAEAAGAAGVVIFNQGNGPGRFDSFFGTLGTPGSNIPVVGAAYSVGVELAAGGVTVSMVVDVISEFRMTKNVLAETSGGDDGNVIMVGAHLDSVPAGPGIQDNGSGSAVILEVALQMSKVKPRNKVRFAWWGAEELGLLGSFDYVGSLSQDEIDSIAAYLNFDMIASPNYGFFVYDGDDSDGIGFPAGPEGSDVIENIFETYYSKIGEESRGTDFSGGSDYVAFINAGIPSGGLFTGAGGIKTPDEVLLWGGTAGDQYDPCYHLACDTFDNVSLHALDVNSDAAAFAILQLAMNTKTLNGKKGKGNFKLDRNMEYRGPFIQQ
jgi:Zn-dependent M28 family amino/carboxypeptidase